MKTETKTDTALLFEGCRRLLRWYPDAARPLPWRDAPTPYRVWVSEVMLQQTRIEAVRPYFTAFLEKAPTPASLASLDEDTLFKLWEGLGYYSRVRNLQKAARQIQERFGGALPADYGALLSLAGVGEYTAGAIGSIAFGLPTPAVDGNVLRVLSRLLADDSNVLSPKTQEKYRTLLTSFYNGLPEKTEKDNPRGTLTQALMELGQTLCPPNKRPLCTACPLQELCKSKDGLFEKIPVRQKKKERRKEKMLVLLLLDGEGKYALRRRPEKGLLGGMFELPTIPLADEKDEEAQAFLSLHGLRRGESVALPSARHIFTHVEWEIEGLLINVEREKESELLFLSPREIREKIALPSAYHAYLPFLFGAVDDKSHTKKEKYHE